MRRTSIDAARSPSGSASTSSLVLCDISRAPATAHLLRRNSASSAVSLSLFSGAPAGSGQLLTAALLPMEADTRQLATCTASGPAWCTCAPMGAQPSGYTALAHNTSFGAAVPAANGLPLTAAAPVAAASPFAAFDVQGAQLVTSSSSADSDEEAFGLPKRAAQWPMRAAFRRSSAGPAALDKMRNAARNRLLGDLRNRNRSVSNLRRRGSRHDGCPAPAGRLTTAAAGLDILQDLNVCAAVESFRAAVA